MRLYSRSMWLWKGNYLRGDPDGECPPSGFYETITAVDSNVAFRWLRMNGYDLQRRVASAEK